MAAAHARSGRGGRCRDGHELVEPNRIQWNQVDFSSVLWDNIGTTGKGKKSEPLRTAVHLYARTVRQKFSNNYNVMKQPFDAYVLNRKASNRIAC